MRELKGLLVEQLHDLLNAENQIVGALPKIVEAAHNAKLKELFGNHLTQTEKQVKRLELSLKTLGETTDSKPGKATKRLLEEGQQTIEDGEDRGRFDARSSIDRCAESATLRNLGIRSREMPCETNWRARSCDSPNAYAWKRLLYCRGGK